MSTSDELLGAAERIRGLMKTAIPGAHFYTRQVLSEIAQDLEEMAKESHRASWSAPVCDRGRPGCIVEHDELQGESAHYPN